MSFLNVKIPAVTIDSLIEDIRKQIELSPLQFFYLEGDLIQNPTRELKRLIEVLKTELKEPFLEPALLSVSKNEEAHLSRYINISVGVCYILCIRKNEAGGAFWTDGLRQYEPHKNTFLKCDEGLLKAETGKGGTYLLLKRQYALSYYEATSRKSKG